MPLSNAADSFRTMLTNFLVRANRFPPIFVRLLARHHPWGKPITTIEIADRSGLSPARVDAISQCTDWRGIDILEMSAFTKACECDLFSRRDMKRIQNYLQGAKTNGHRSPPSFAYLKKDPDWLPYYRPLLQRYRESLKMKLNAT